MSMRAGDGCDRPPLATGDDSGEADPLFCIGVRQRTLSRLHAEKLALCDLLEEIADSLPQALDRDQCLAASGKLEPLLREAHTYEEGMLFPAYVRAQGNTRSAVEIVARLKAEHIEDADFATELADGLRRLGEGAEAANVEAVGYMLRGFFAAMRRHIANEREAMAGFLSETG
ncbi:hemerythrin domain-containing protein [Mesorhizobium sp. KR1-2]|uniref:hemerythrin domain-containing protein n=1 Tax=Mesorhizobium sp. KR1-2 TaxID=3156609 RepID=UPI0032B31198